MARAARKLLILSAVFLLVLQAGFASAQATFPSGPNPNAVATFQSIGLYWHGVGGAAQTAQVEFKKAGAAAWRRGLDLWFDSRNSEYRGSIVELEPGTTYDIRLTLQGTSTSAVFQASTWSETFAVPAGYEIKLPPPPGGARIARIVLNPANVPAPTSSLSGRELTISVPTSGSGYTLITADPGNHIVDPTGTPALGGAAFDNQVDSCILVNQGVQRVIVRGLELRNCRRHGVFFWRNLSSGAQTRDIVIENNLITGWGSFGRKEASFPDNDAAIGCSTPGVALNLRPVRIIAQRNTLSNPRHNSTPWGPNKIHPRGPQGFQWSSCGRNHVIRYNDITGTEGQKHFMDGIGGAENFSNEGFPWADSDINGNLITHVYDDGIEAEGGNRNVRIWGNYIDRAFVAIANGATAVGPLYVWRNVSNDMALLYDPADSAEGHNTRGPFVKAGASSGAPSFNGGRAYYFHNTLLQPPTKQSQPYPRGAGDGLLDSAGSEPFYNFVSLNNIWHIHKVPHLGGSSDHWGIQADCNVRGPCTADYDLYNGRMGNASNPGSPEPNGFGNPTAGDVNSVPTYASSGGSYPATSALPSAANGWSGNFALGPGSRGYQGGVHLPNFNDLQDPDPGAHQSGTPAMRFGVAAAPDPGGPGATADLTAAPTSGSAPLEVQFDSSHSFTTAVTYHIDFGDQTSSTLPNPRHTYQNAGRYTAMLTVTETSTSRTATDSVTIDVGPQGGGGGTTPSSFGLFVSAGPGLVINRAAGESINFSVEAADARALTRVRFFIDGVERLADTSAPFQFTWLPSASDATGNHTLLVEATDTGNNVAFESRTLTLLSATCNIFVSALSLTHGDPLQVQGVCSDTQTVDSVDFFVDNVLQSGNRDATPAYTWTMDTSGFAVGTRAVRFRALRSGASIGEDTVNVQIVAAPLTLSFSPGPVVSRTEGMTVTASATDGRALKQVDFYVNGEFRAGENVAPHRLSWPASGSSARPDRFGQQQLVVHATDMEGNVLTAKRDLYVLTQTCNVRVATSKYQVGSHDTVLAGPHTVVQGELLVVQGLCSASQSVQQIEFYIDGANRLTDVIAPYGVIFSTGALAPGSHTVSIIARLADGTSSSHSIPIEIVAPR